MYELPPELGSEWTPDGSHSWIHKSGRLILTAPSYPWHAYKAYAGQWVLEPSIGRGGVYCSSNVQDIVAVALTFVLTGEFTDNSPYSKPQ